MNHAKSSGLLGLVWVTAAACASHGQADCASVPVHGASTQPSPPPKQSAISALNETIRSVGPAQYVVMTTDQSGATTSLGGYEASTKLCKCEELRSPTWSIPTAGATISFLVTEDGAPNVTQRDSSIPTELVDCVTNALRVGEARKCPCKTVVTFFPSTFRWLGPPKDGWRVGIRVFEARATLTEPIVREVLRHHVDRMLACVVNTPEDKPDRFDVGATLRVGRTGNVDSVATLDLDSEQGVWEGTCQYVRVPEAPESIEKCIVRTFYGIQLDGANLLDVIEGSESVGFALRFQRAW